MRAPRLPRYLVAAALLCLPAAAGATPITYLWAASPDNKVTISATVVPLSGPATPVTFDGLGSKTIALTGSSFTFDSALVPLAGNDNSIVGFTFVTAPTGAIAITGLGPVTSATLGAITVTTGTLFVSSATGTGPYSFSMGPVAASGLITTNLGGPTAFSGQTPLATNGSINLGTNTIIVKDITIASIAFGTSTLLVKGDFSFHGVPEPGSAVLFLMGAIAIGGALRRR